RQQPPPTKALNWLARNRGAAAALVAGFAAGAILTGGLLPGGESNTSALAGSIPHRLVAAAQRLQGYRATFDITELHWTRADPVRGRDAVAVQLAYQDATPLFDYLRFLGSWRPFFPQDRVVLWLDRTTWFPLRYEVFPASGPERALWAAENGLPREPSGRPVFTATIGSLSTAVAPAALFVPGSVLRAFASRPGQGVTDQGFRDQSAGAAPPEI